MHALNSHGAERLILIFIFLAQYNCGSPALPLNGQVIIENSTLGMEAVYSCVLGFILIGSNSRRCDLNNNWSGDQPICEGEITLSM